jgi:Spy/CpxP family protein refolding chaperone
MAPGRWWKRAGVAKALALDDAQIQKIEQIFQDSRLKLVDLHASLQKEEIKLEPMIEADNPDENAVLGAIDRIAADRAALVKANAQMAFAIRRVLTPEQWKKLRTSATTSLRRWADRAAASGMTDRLTMTGRRRRLRRTSLLRATFGSQDSVA